MSKSLRTLHCLGVFTCVVVVLHKQVNRHCMLMHWLFSAESTPGSRTFLTLTTFFLQHVFCADASRQASNSNFVRGMVDDRNDNFARPRWTGKALESCDGDGLALHLGTDQCQLVTTVANICTVVQDVRMHRRVAERLVGRW